MKQRKGLLLQKAALLGVEVSNEETKKGHKLNLLFSENAKIPIWQFPTSAARVISLLACLLAS